MIEKVELIDKPSEVVSDLIAKQIARIKRGQRFIDYWDAREFGDELNELRNSILSFSEQNPGKAFELMYNFLDTHAKVLDRCDDSDGIVSGEYSQACHDLGEIGQRASLEYSKASDIVLKMLMNNPFSMYDGIIFDFKDILKNEGLELLKNKLMSQLSEAQIGKEVARKQSYHEKFKVYYFDKKKSAENLSAEFRGEAIKEISDTIRGGLAAIADCRNDVEEYIKALIFPKTSYKYKDFPDWDKKEIAKRLLEQGRTEEALEWLNAVKIDYERDSSSEIIQLKIKVLELLNKPGEAQKERVLRFNATMDPEIFGEVIKNATDDFREKFKKDSIERALTFPNIYAAMNFLAECGFLKECSDFVQEKIKIIQGGYHLIRRVAKALAPNYQLSALLLYRKSIDEIMNNAQRDHYSNAVNDLISCEKLDRYIDEYRDFQTHAQYYEIFCEKHKKKKKFWDIYNNKIKTIR